MGSLELPVTARHRTILKLGLQTFLEDEAAQETVLDRQMWT